MHELGQNGLSHNNSLRSKPNFIKVVGKMTKTIRGLTDVPFYEEVMGYLRDKAYAEGYQEGLNEYRRPILDVLYKYLIFRFGQSAEYFHSDLYALDFGKIQQLRDVLLNSATIVEMEQVLRRIQTYEEPAVDRNKGNSLCSRPV